MRKLLKLSDNRLLTETEYQRVCRFCDVIGALALRAPTGQADGGKWWDESSASPPMRAVLAKDRNYIDHSLLLDTRFRDFPTIMYDLDGFDAGPDYYARRYQRLKSALPKKWHVKTPPGFGEIGWDIDGHAVNRHTMITQERISAMYLLGALDNLSKFPSPVVLEIGPGAGETADTICRALPRCTWISVDLCDSLIHSAMHLAIWHPNRRHVVYAGREVLPETVDQRLIVRTAAEVLGARGSVISVPSYLLSELVEHLQVDLALNFWSFGEMAPDIVSSYAAALGKMLGLDGALIEQNTDDANGGSSNPKNILGRFFSSRYGVDTLLNRPPFAGALDIWCNRPQQWPAVWPQDERMKIIQSFEDHGDVLDVEYNPVMWGRLQDYGLR